MNDLVLNDITHDSFDSYVNAVSKIPVLTPEEERDLMLRYKNNNDLEAARKLVVSNLRFVVKIACEYKGYGFPVNDLIQEGNIGLMKAVKKYDLGYSNRLLSFAVSSIRAEIHEFILRNWGIIKIATTKAQRKLFFNLRKFKEDLKWLSQSEIKNIAKELKVNVDTVVEMEKRLSAIYMSFDMTDDYDYDDDYVPPALYLSNLEGDPLRQLELLEDSRNKDNRMNKISKVLKSLDPRSRDIIQSRWMSDKKLTLKELANKYNVTHERIRQLETLALQKINLEVSNKL